MADLKENELENNDEETTMMPGEESTEEKDSLPIEDEKKEKTTPVEEPAASKEETQAPIKNSSTTEQKTKKIEDPKKSSVSVIETNNNENLPNFRITEKFGAKNLKSEEDAMIDYLSKVKDLTNSSNLKLNSMVKVTVVDKVATGTYTKSLFCKEIIAYVVNNKIGNVKFINKSRATSFIALVRDLTQKDYGAVITNATKCKIIKYVIDGNGLDIK